MIGFSVMRTKSLTVMIFQWNEPPLNEEDDDDLDDMEQGEDQNTHHLVLAQFDKVTTFLHFL